MSWRIFIIVIHETSGTHTGYERRNEKNKGHARRPMLRYLLMSTTKCARHSEADMRNDMEMSKEDDDAEQRKHENRDKKRSQYRSLKLK